MYCLDCGHKITGREESCPNCGMTLAEMRERLAVAQEMVTYADTVGPAPTEKLPPVAERSYKDKDGKEFDPGEYFDLTARTVQKDLQALPQIGKDDPYVTMPIKRVVADSGEVIADVDREQKTYLQISEKKGKTSKKR